MMMMLEWSQVKDSLEAGLETANNLTAVAGSVAGAFGTIGGVTFSESDGKTGWGDIFCLSFRKEISNIISVVFVTDTYSCPSPGPLNHVE